MDSNEQSELAKAIADLVRKDPRVRQAIWDCACSCPNLVVEY